MNAQTKRSMSHRVWDFYQKNILSRNQAKPRILTGGFIVPLTTKCNFVCKHCLRQADDGRDFPFELIEKIALAAKKYNYNYFSFTGGEPLLYPFFKQTIELIASSGYFFNFATNGYIFEKFTDLLRQYRRNLFGVVFSLESVDKDKQDYMRQKGSFDRLIEDFSICRRLKLPFTIQTVITTQNVDELLDLAVFAKKKGAQALRVTTAVPCTRTQENDFILGSSQREKLYEAVRLIPQFLKYPILFTAAVKADNNINLCGMNIMTLSFNVDGDFVQCCDLANFDVEKIRQKAVITSLRDKSFDEAIKIVFEYQYKFFCRRMADYQKQDDVTHIDFNSCFYCFRKLGQ